MIFTMYSYRYLNFVLSIICIGIGIYVNKSFKIILVVGYPTLPTLGWSPLFCFHIGFLKPRLLFSYYVTYLWVDARFYVEGSLLPTYSGSVHLMMSMKGGVIPTC